MKKTQILSCSILLGLCFISLAFSDKEKKTKIKSNLPTGIQFSMLVDGKEWQPVSLNYISFLVESESMGNNYVMSVSAYSTDQDNRSDQGDDPHQESMHFSFSIPASQIETSVGTYDIGETVESETVTSYNGLVHYVGNNHQKYMPDYKINPKSGTITITKAEFGDQGAIGEFPIGDGLKIIEGTFEFGLYLTDDSSKKNLKITKGRFILKTGEW